jgi:putative transcriptional regulator
MKKKRNLGEEILEGLREIKAGGGKRYTVFSAEHIHNIREKMSLSQSAFAGLLGVSIRTLQGWEQGRRKPRGAAVALLRVASRHPETLIR